ncbi:hypothetical protein AKJ65_06145 [candidate division MSBL1 archaeon SCGC-AAA259E19]|uniref:Uncharacterized protein n=1 Tax=candidate division MSBL1 archaeon SCGC-AAA259E19 TaxID=1698264 RepID=A0A133UH86_9EURY|nr:hypothetical protein AKJ65_06145 [candidate division MSBL1 archaeon SCGC-AAA259E19]
MIIRLGIGKYKRIKMSEDGKNLDVFLKLAKNKLEDTVREFVSLREYMGILIAADSMAAVLIGIIFQQDLLGLQIALVSAGIILVGISIAFSLKVISHTNEYLRLESEDIRKGYKKGKLNKEDVSEELLAAAEYNDEWLSRLKPYVRTARWITISCIFVLLFVLSWLLLT